MARGRRPSLNRRDLRAAAEAAERLEAETADQEEQEEEEEAADEEEEAEAGDEEEADEVEVKPKPAKKKAAKAAKAPKVAKPRKSRATKSARMKVVWGVFNNSNARVATFEYPRKTEADALAAKLTADKKSTHFVNPVKEPIEEKKEPS